MSFWDEPEHFYFHDLWKRTPSTWGGGASFTWTRVEVQGGPKRQQPTWAKDETARNAGMLSLWRSSGIARRFRWTGSAWVLEEVRDTARDTGDLGDRPASSSESWLAVAAPMVALAIVLDVATGASWTK